jgi:carbon-monoxide dehydrogenase medium subunit
MKPATFDYYRPKSVDDAVSTLAESAFAKILAGGQSLVPSMNFRLSTPSLLIDIGQLDELKSVEASSDAVTIGAAATQHEVESSAAVAAVVPGLRAALRWIGHRPIRNRGTICGSLAHADPAAELPALAVATGATLTLRGPAGSRTVGASDFFRGPFWTDLQSGEIITHVRFPAQAPGITTRVNEIARRSGDFALVGVIASIGSSNGSVGSAVLSGFGVGGTPVRLTSAEGVLRGQEALDEAARMELYEAAYTDAGDPFEDVHASTEYRREALASLVVRTATAIMDGSPEKGDRS